jgi:hypothetical protein
MLNLSQLAKFLRTSLRVLLDVLTLFRTGLRSRGALAAENLFLRMGHDVGVQATLECDLVAYILLSEGAS